MIWDGCALSNLIFSASAWGMDFGSPWSPVLGIHVSCRLRYRMAIHSPVDKKLLWNQFIAVRTTEYMLKPSVFYVHVYKVRCWTFGAYRVLEKIRFEKQTSEKLQNKLTLTFWPSCMFKTPVPAINIFGFKRENIRHIAWTLNEKRCNYGRLVEEIPWQWPLVLLFLFCSSLDELLICCMFTVKRKDSRKPHLIPMQATPHFQPVQTPFTFLTCSSVWPL